MHFNFKKQLGNMATTSEKIIQVITKDPARRSRMEINLLLPWLRKKSEILASVENDVLVDLLRHCDYVKVPRDHIIIRQGDIGDSFYIMLTGRTSVYIDPLETDEETPLTVTRDFGELREKQEKREKKEQEEQADQGKQSNESQQQKEAVEASLDRTNLGRFIVKFDADSLDSTGVGKAFGELALMSEDSVRNASIVADEETDLLVINRDLFNRSLKLKQQQEYEERRTFIENSPLFRSWNAKFRRLLEISIRKEVYPFGATMVRQGEPVQGLHFIVTGQAQVTVEPAQHKHQYPKLFETPQSIISREFGKHDSKSKLPDLATEVSTNSGDRMENRQHHKREERSRDSIQREHIRVRRKQGYAAAEKRLAHKSLTVSCLENNEVIGDIEVILGLETYTNTVVCTARTEAFLLDMKNLDRLVYKKNMATMSTLTKIVEDKLCSRARSPQVGQQVALYKCLYEKVRELKPSTQSMASGVTAAATAGGSQRDARSVQKEASSDRQQKMAQLVKLFLLDRTPLISPSVPGTLYYLSKSVQRIQNQIKAKRKADDNSLSANVRLERARKFSRRKPLSRRELERMCAGEPIDYVKEYAQNKEHAIGRILGMRPKTAVGSTPLSVNSHGPSAPGSRPPGVKDRSRQHTTTDTLSEVNTTVSEPAPQSSGLPHVPHADADAEASSLLDFADLPEDAEGQTFDADDVDEEVLRRVMADMGGYQQLRQSARARIICSMLEKKAPRSATRNILRPKSAPVPLGEVGSSDHEDDIDDNGEESEHFDWDTSDPALTSLEDKIKCFLAKYDRNCTTAVDGESAEPAPRRTTAPVAELKRFVVEGPDDIPIPGGTVFVRQKMCRFPAGVACPSHQHVRRYMIPKNAYTLATKSLAEITRERPSTSATTTTPARPTSARPTTRPRPTTAAPRSRGLSSASTHSAWG